MKFTYPLAFLALPLITCRAATVTLMLVQTETPKFPRPSETFSPLGVGSDGATTYLDEVVVSVYYEQQLNGGVTTITSGGSVTTSFITVAQPISTVTVEPVTLRGTLVADASHLVFHQEPNPTGTRFDIIGGNSLSCDLDGRGGGACVEAFWQKGGSTMTTSYTGSAVPYYTLVIADTQGGNNGAVGREVLMGSGVVTVGILFGFFQVLL